MTRFDREGDEAFAPLLAAAEAARANAYAPYSKYLVGAALSCGDGSVIVAGCNVENASFGATICAERNAVLHAVSLGHRTFGACVVVTQGPEPAAPCGLCRQVLAEFAPALPILLFAASTSARRLVRLDEIFPATFGAADLAHLTK